MSWNLPMTLHFLVGLEVTNWSYRSRSITYNTLDDSFLWAIEKPLMSLVYICVELTRPNIRNAGLDEILIWEVHPLGLVMSRWSYVLDQNPKSYTMLWDTILQFFFFWDMTTLKFLNTFVSPHSLTLKVWCISIKIRTYCYYENIE